MIVVLVVYVFCTKTVIMGSIKLFFQCDQFVTNFSINMIIVDINSGSSAVSLLLLVLLDVTFIFLVLLFKVVLGKKSNEEGDKRLEW